MRRHSKKIVFLIPYPLNAAPSQRFRFEQYFSLLERNNFKITILPFLNQSGWKLLYSTNHLYKNIQLIGSTIRRPFDLFRIFSCDFVFIHREALPFGPPLLEWLISRIIKKKIIYDFDDAIWLTDKKSESLIQRTIRWRQKVSTICSWSHTVSCGNNYLFQYAIQFTGNALINPTTIDPETQHNPILYSIHKDERRVVIGWTGSHSTLKYLHSVEHVLQKIQDRFPHVDVVVIADQKPPLKLKRLIFQRWNMNTEISDLMKIDIGIMPLPDDEWSKGKCGFKALQYMALEIPPVASPVGVNTEIIQHEFDGYLCTTEEEWTLALEKLINNADLRKQIGKAARKKVIDHFSVSSNSDNFLSLFQ